MTNRLLLLFILFFNTIIGDQGFLEGTLVKTTAGYKAIEKIRPGDYVYCADDKLNCSRQPVKTITQQKSLGIVAVKINNTTILCGADQLFYLTQERRWEQAQYLTSGYLLYDANNNFIPISDVKIINQSRQLFDLNINKYHNFYVSDQNICVHNFEPISTGTGAVYVLSGGLATGAVTAIASWSTTIGLGAAALGWKITKYFEKRAKISRLKDIETYNNAQNNKQYNSSKAKIQTQSQHKPSSKHSETDTKQKNKNNDAQAPGKSTKVDGFIPAKKWSGKKVKHPKTGQYGYPNKKGNVWVPTGPGPLAHGGPHWDVVDKAGNGKNIMPGGHERGTK